MEGGILASINENLVRIGSRYTDRQTIVANVFRDLEEITDLMIQSSRTRKHKERILSMLEALTTIDTGDLSIDEQGCDICHEDFSLDDGKEKAVRLPCGQ